MWSRRPRLARGHEISQRAFVAFALKRVGVLALPDGPRQYHPWEIDQASVMGGERPLSRFARLPPD